MRISIFMKVRHKLYLFFMVVFCLSSVSAQIDQQSDSLSIKDSLQPVISSTELENMLTKLISPALIIERDYMQNPLGSGVFPVSALGAKEIESTNQFSLQDALNQIPGVKMDSRGLNGSRRLNLRGTLTRSPFGVRNIRMTMNGFAITSSDGSSALELLEPSDISEMRIYKGPTGSFSLPGTGGLVAVNLKQKQHGQYEIQLGAGEFGGQLGLGRTYASVGFGKKRLKSTLSGVYSENSGYRTHEANHKAQITLNSRLNLNNKLSYDLLAMLYDGYWELPGHITAEQVAEDPSQSNSYSQDHNASVSRRRAYLGISQRWNITEQFRNETRVFQHYTDKLNPYGNNGFFQGLKDETAQEFGGRSEFILNPLTNNYSRLTVKFGGQVQYFQTQIEEYVNDLGKKGDLKYDNETFITEGLVFGSADWHPIERLDVTAQLGYNLYNITNNGLNAEGDNLEFKVATRQKLLPRAGVSYRLINGNTKLSASYAHGMAYPSIFEWVDTETGLFSESLKPEESINYEFQVVSKLLRSHLEVSASAYYSDLTNTITEIDNDEGVLFINAGESTQKGIEFLSSYNFKHKTIKYSVYLSSTLTDYEFVNDTSDLKLRVPGIVPVTLAPGLKIGTDKWQADVHARFISEVPLVPGDELLDDSEYVLLNAKVNWEIAAKGRIKISAYLGVNNALNSVYTSFFRLSPRDQVFNPMPGRNFYAGISVKRV